MGYLLNFNPVFEQLLKNWTTGPGNCQFFPLNYDPLDNLVLKVSKTHTFGQTDFFLVEIPTVQELMFQFNK